MVGIKLNQQMYASTSNSPRHANYVTSTANAPKSIFSQYFTVNDISICAVQKF